MRRSIVTLSGEQVTLPATLVESVSIVGPGTAIAGITFNSNGTYLGAGGGNWLTPPRTGAGADYEVIWETGTGTLSNGTPDVYQALTSGYTYDRRRLVVGTSAATGTIRIRRVGSGTAADSSAATLEATVE